MESLCLGTIALIVAPWKFFCLKTSTLHNRRNFLRISGELRQGDRAPHLAPILACNSRFALVSLSPLLARNAQK